MNYHALLTDLRTYAGVEVFVGTGVDGAPATQVLFELGPTVI